jgi:hypothetical protein
MPRFGDAIRIRVADREGLTDPRHSREAFWAPLRESEEFSNQGIPQLEAKLCREFGGEERGRTRVSSNVLAGLVAFEDLLPCPSK